MTDALQAENGKRKRIDPWTIMIAALWVGLISALLYVIPGLRDAARRASGGNDLKGAILTTLSYQDDHDGALPPLDQEPGRLMFSRDEMFPEYCELLSSITCEFDPTTPAPQGLMDRPENRIADNVDDHSMFYLGYFLESEAQGLAFVEAYKAQAAAGGDFTSNLDAPPGQGSFGSNQFVRLSCDASAIMQLAKARTDLELSFDKLIARIPVMIERPEHHRKRGGHVAYLDGGVAWHDYPAEWPMTERFITALQSLDRLGPDTNK